MWEHGDYVVGKCGQVQLFSGRGPWNDEALKRGILETSKNIKSLDKTRPWAQLSCLCGESLFPPSTYSIFVEQTKIRKSAGMKALAVVIINSDISTTIKQQLSVGYDEAEVNYKFFTSINDAIHWLITQDIEVDAESVSRFFNDNPL